MRTKIMYSLSEMQIGDIIPSSPQCLYDYEVIERVGWQYDGHYKGYFGVRVMRNKTHITEEQKYGRIIQKSHLVKA